MTIAADIQAKVGTLSPINVATQGLFNCPLSVAAVRGRLICLDDTVEEGGGSGGKRRKPHGGVIMPARPHDIDDQSVYDDAQLALLAVTAIEDHYG